MRLELTLDAPAGGDASVGRDADGRAVFASGGLPGERVIVRVHTEKKRHARGDVIEVLAASPGRRSPVCATARAGCGGCDLAHAIPDLQRGMKRRVVRDALTRIAGLADPPPIAMTSTSDERYRTTLRGAVESGRAGYRRRASHDVVVAEECLVAHPLAERVLVEGRWGTATEVLIRVSAATGESIAVVDADLAGVEAPDGVRVASREDLEAGHDLHVTEEAAGRRWRVSAGSFFQAGPAAATALVDSVRRHAGDTAGRTVVDLYAGVGLFAGTVGAAADEVIAVESAASSAADARHNLADVPATIVEDRVERWRPTSADLVIADPSRAGLGRRGVDVIGATGADRVVLVSCDTGALGRDVGLLAQAGFSVGAVEIVDAFPDTGHVEAVVALAR